MRQDGRKNDEIREIKFTPRYIDNVPGSVLLQQGNMKINCTATFENRVPYFLKEEKRGWVTAEYSMLPGSTGSKRNMRERERKNNRNIEIQRFIGRALRNCFDLKAVDGINIFIDTDVMQADGSTRCAGINCGMLVLSQALRHLVFENKIADLPDIEVIAAVSVGIKGEDILVDLTFAEDCAVDADINVVSSEKENIIEIQAFAEESPVAKAAFFKAVELGVKKNLEIIKQLKKQMEV
ncbi:MAG: ribonuclease PH [Candidatus Aminicenantes bacterium]|nr:ribonuclease PH [Candidatus Aminicenantes bacterium]